MGDMVQCTLCPRECQLGPNQRGDCRSRINVEGKLMTLVYGKPCSVHVDPVEKKPMFHFLPGTGIFSIATAGCNLHCKFCQNFEISQVNPEDAANVDLPPEAVVRSAKQSNCKSIAYTYSDPIIFYEYTRDTSALARQAGLRNVLVTAGFINEEPLRKLCQVTDGANLDIKAFSEDFYRNVCGGKLAPVLRCAKVMKEEGVLVEITNLIVPTLNDDLDLIKRLCGWLVKEMGPDTPMHFSRFYPMYLIRNLPSTPESILVQARNAAIAEGLNYVYIGNVFGGGGEDTVCPSCKKTIIKRYGFNVLENHVAGGKCEYCGYAIIGIWS